MRTLLGIPAVLFLMVPLQAQEPASAQPSTDHGWLHQFVGQWTSTSKSAVVEGQPQVQGKGSMRSEKLGEFWVINHFTAEMSGTSLKAIQTLGYDSSKKKYTGTWVDSMMGHLWLYEGELDDTGKKLILTAEGPNFMTGTGSGKYRDSYEFKSPNLILATSEALDEDGNWVTFMTGEMRRVAD